MSKIKVDIVSNRSDDGPPSLPNGATIPAGKPLIAQGSVNIVGVATVGIVSSVDISCETINASTFVGDGSGLTNLPGATPAKVYAFKLIFDQLPFRS